MAFPISDERLNDLLEIISQASDMDSDEDAEKFVDGWVKEQDDKDDLLKALTLILKNEQ